MLVKFQKSVSGYFQPQRYRPEEGIEYDEVFAHFDRIEANRLFLAFASYMGFTKYQTNIIFGNFCAELIWVSVCNAHKGLRLNWLRLR